MKTNLKKAMKQIEALDHEDYMEQEYGKKGTKERKEADKRLEKLRKELVKKATK